MKAAGRAAGPAGDKAAALTGEAPGRCPGPGAVVAILKYVRCMDGGGLAAKQTPGLQGDLPSTSQIVPLRVLPNFVSVTINSTCKFPALNWLPSNLSHNGVRPKRG